MLVDDGNDARSSYLLLSINALSVFLSLTVFFTSEVVEAFQQRVEKKTIKRKTPPRTKLQIVQISFTAIITALSIVHAALLAKSGYVNGQTDAVLVSALFLILVWIIFLLGLVDRESIAGNSYLRAWALGGICDFAALILFVVTSSFKGRPLNAIDLTIQLARVLAIAGLVTGSAIFKWRNSSKDVNSTSEETQPLLGNEANDSAVINGKKQDEPEAKKGEGNNDDKDEDEDEDEREEVVDKKALEELKRRPLRQYIASFAIFLPHLKPNTRFQWACIGVMAVCTFLQRLINVALPLTLGALINKLVDSHTIPWPQVLAYLSLTVLSTAGLISMFSDLASAQFTSSAKMSLDRFAYDHIMTLSCEFHEAENSNRLGRLIDRGDVVAELFQLLLFRVLPQISDLFISLAVLAWLFGGYLCFVVATTIVLFGWANTKFIKKKTKLRRKWWDSMEAQWRHLFETNYNWMTVSHFNRVPYEQEQFGVKTKEMYKRGLATSNFDAVAQFVRQAIVSVGFIAACLISIGQIVYGAGGVGQFAMLVTYWNQVMNPVTGLIRLVNKTSEDLVDAERLLVILEQKPKIKDSDDAKDIDFQGGAVDFENVTFSYDGQRIVSEDISFHIDAGQTVAIVGETGGGKSTLLKLLFRFYDTTKGRILIDGQDVRDLKLESFRDLIGFVPQDPAMFERSVADNVRYPDLTATDEDVQEACEGAVLHKKIMTFTQGYKQRVGKKGARLSGGEQQRLAIARCILKKPKMLLLDEATSSVDSVTETKIHEGLKKLCKGRTTFIIAHRLSTILHADQILVMKNGKLVEAGPHRVLIKQDGAYKELWDAQLKLQEANPDESDEKATNVTDAVLGDTATEKTLINTTSETEGRTSSSSRATSSKSPVRAVNTNRKPNDDNDDTIKKEDDEDASTTTSGDTKSKPKTN